MEIFLKFVILLLTLNLLSVIIIGINVDRKFNQLMMVKVITEEPKKEKPKKLKYNPADLLNPYSYGPVEEINLDPVVPQFNYSKNSNN